MAAKIVLCESKYESSWEESMGATLAPNTQADTTKDTDISLQMYEWAGTRLSHQSATNTPKQLIT